MKNILLLSSLYPSDDVKTKNNTSVCHYFAKEWLKMGYNVRVFYLYNEYPRFLYPILKIAQGFLANKVSTAILAERKHQEYNYLMDGIKVTRIPVYKKKPHGDFSENVISLTVDRVRTIIHRESFVPDYILGHCILPGVRIVSSLGASFPNAVTAVTIHGIENKKILTVQNCLPKIDYIGYRSYPIKNSFEQIYGERPCFMCFSGVPESYITQGGKNFENGVHKYIYVGNFMKRKFPSVIIPAIAKNYKEGDFSITYVGDGNGKNTIDKQVKEYHAENNVIFTGRVDRTEVTKLMDNSEVFIMISKAETFGLVYLEAMARGCITIASRNEGMDGIIVNGENGFLCNAGDSEELGRIIEAIKQMDQDSLCKVSMMAIKTASKMTDKIMAEEYIKALSR